MKSAQASSQKFVERASQASGDYVTGVQSTSKDQAALAIASAERHKQATIAALNDGRYAKGLTRSGTSGWKEGVTKKGANRFSEGVSGSASKYAVRSAEFDSARGAADNLPKGLKGSETNLARVKAVVTALRTQKVGSGK
jgi:hypothetical protein